MLRRQTAKELPTFRRSVVP